MAIDADENTSLAASFVYPETGTVIPPNLGGVSLVWEPRDEYLTLNPAGTGSYSFGLWQALQQRTGQVKAPALQYSEAAVSLGADLRHSWHAACYPVAAAHVCAAPMPKRC